MGGLALGSTFRAECFSSARLPEGCLRPGPSGRRAVTLPVPLEGVGEVAAGGLCARL